MVEYQIFCSQSQFKSFYFWHGRAYIFPIEREKTMTQLFLRTLAEIWTTPAIRRNMSPRARRLMRSGD